jgi:hypothetical protein
MNLSYRSFAIAALAAACLISPAWAGKVKTVVPKDGNLAQYKTYTWLPPRVLTKMGIAEDHPANAVLKDIVTKHLAAVGLTEVAKGGDLEIQTLVFTVSVPQLEAVIIGEGYNFDYGTIVAAMGRYNREGTLAINMIDPKIKKSAWAGMVTNNINRGELPPNELREKLQQAADQIFKKYPLAKK